MNLNILSALNVVNIPLLPAVDAIISVNIRSIIDIITIVPSNKFRFSEDYPLIPRPYILKIISMKNIIVNTKFDKLNIF